MKHPMKSVVIPAVMAIVQLSSAAVVGAQNQAANAFYMSAASVPTNISGVYTYPEPPNNFSPLTASNEELATYGFPTRPDKQADPDHYTLWERAMKAAKHRWNGELKPLRINARASTGPALKPAEDQLSAAATAATGPIKANNEQASGVLLNNGLTHWSSTSSFTDIWSVITVPVTQLPFDNTTGCTGSNYWSVSLVGIDGYRFGSLFQPEEAVGVLQRINCPQTYTINSAVFGWEEAFQTAFSLNPGDAFYTEVHAFGGCNNGSAFIEDLTTLTYNAYTITNPCDTVQNGRTANWIVYRPPFGNKSQLIGGNSPLANTLQISFDGAEVLNTSGTAFYPGSQATSTVVMTMREDSDTEAIELVNQGSSGYQGLHSLWFQTTGCAFTGGCNP